MNLVTNLGQKGQSLFEVILALGISAVVLLGIVSLATSAVKNSTFSNNNARATKFAQQASEWLRAQRDLDWADFVGRAGSTYCLSDNILSDSSWNSGACGSSEFISGNSPFLRQVTFTCFINSAVPPSVVFATSSCSASGVIKVDSVVRVWWTDTQGEHNVQTQTSLTNWPR